MRLASVYLPDGRPAIVAVDGDDCVVLREDAALGADIDFDEVARTPGSGASAFSCDDLVFRPVVPAPRRIVCLGSNYHAHVEEMGREVPSYPVLFTKWPSSLTGAGAAIPLPEESVEIDFEAELALVIGTPGRRIPPSRALEHLAGVTIANDVTMRDYQYKTHQWLQGKAWDGCTPLGPVILTMDEVDDVHGLSIRLELNGEVLQSSDTSRLIFDVPTIISTISEFTCLERGDVILTGTPGGVGYRRDPQVFLHPGDTATVTVDGVGELTNTFVAEERSAAAALGSDGDGR